VTASKPNQCSVLFISAPSVQYFWVVPALLICAALHKGVTCLSRFLSCWVTVLLFRTSCLRVTFGWPLFCRCGTHRSIEYTSHSLAAAAAAAMGSWQHLCSCSAVDP
jgi:hypothetical protein